MRAPDFWDDQEQASQVSAEYSRLKRRLEEFAELEGRFADLETTEELCVRSSPATPSTTSSCRSS